MCVRLLEKHLGLCTDLANSTERASFASSNSESAWQVFTPTSGCVSTEMTRSEQDVTLWIVLILMKLAG
jgi:hypothetical protein